MKRALTQLRVALCIIVTASAFNPAWLYVFLSLKQKPYASMKKKIKITVIALSAGMMATVCNPTSGWSASSINSKTKTTTGKEIKPSGNAHIAEAAKLNEQAGLLQAQGKYADAEPLYRRALAIREKQLGINHQDVAESLSNLASLLCAQGKYKEEDPFYRSDLPDERALGENHSGVATELNNQAGLFYAQGKFAEAEPLYRRALAIYEKQYGSEDLLVAKGLNNLAELLRAQGKNSETESLYRRALEIREKKSASDSDQTDLATSLNNLAFLLKEQGKYSEAEQLYRRAIAIDEKSLGLNHPITLTLKENLNKLLEKMKLQLQQR